MYVPFVRKYAIRSFDDVIGQPIVVKILKNTLFLDHVFSVYLFAGKHGCGKTSTARLFSMALNCECLSFFRKNPQEKVPCQLCKSCQSMILMQHPDFIEIDAASHTGVDNVRLIIESATLLPLLGKKKIYLIDEAHMLSKAAWNAFLKILEEPPKDVVFILATTAPEKILETVRSRCFQLFFDPISETVLTDFLCFIAKNEQLSYTREGVCQIVSQSRGSVRDALNILDQTRLAVQEITIQSLSALFGNSSDQDIITFFHHIFCKRSNRELLSFFQNILSSDQSTFNSLFERIIFLGRTLLWFLYGQKINDNFVEKFDSLRDINPTLLMHFLSHLYKHEAVLRRSEQPVLFFEVLVLLFFEKIHNLDRLSGDNSKNMIASLGQKEQKQSQDLIEEKMEQQNQQKDVLLSIESAESLPKVNSKWSDFLQEIKVLEDPLLLSIFKQGMYQSFDEITHSVTIVYPRDRNFFADIIGDAKKNWSGPLQKIFGVNATLNPIFSLEVLKEAPVVLKSVREELPIQVQAAALPLIDQKKTDQKKTGYPKSYQYQSKNFVAPVKRSIDIADKEKWQYANLLKTVFPGVITEIEKGDHE